MNIRYIDVEKMDFEKMVVSDSVFFNIHGHNPIYMERDLFVGNEFTISAFWDCEDGSVRIMKCKNEDGTIVSEITIRDLQVLEVIVGLLGSTQRGENPNFGSLVRLGVDSEGAEDRNLDYDDN